MRLALLSLLVATAAAAQPQLALRPVVSGLDLPLGIVNAGDARLFIVQQRGTVVIWNGTRVLSAPFLDIRSLVSCCGERGLLGLAFHPKYAQNGLFYVYYTNTAGDIVIAQYSVSADRDRADASSSKIVLTIPHPQFSNHNGGQLQFGPDGYLYIGTGDGGSAGDPNNNAQNLGVLLGKILRISVPGDNYLLPAGNPFLNQAGARREIWAYGLRNPWRFSFDRDSGDLWIGDVGQNLYEEVDLQRVTSIGGENYGWRRMEGLHCFNPSSGCSDPSYVLPVVEYAHSDGSCSITGGYRYRGTAHERHLLLRRLLHRNDLGRGGERERSVDCREATDDEPEDHELWRGHERRVVRRGPGRSDRAAHRPAAGAPAHGLEVASRR